MNIAKTKREDLPARLDQFDRIVASMEETVDKLPKTHRMHLHLTGGLGFVLHASCILLRRALKNEIPIEERDLLMLDEIENIIIAAYPSICRQVPDPAMREGRK
jgi:hypothetical protein